MFKDKLLGSTVIHTAGVQGMVQSHTEFSSRCAAMLICVLHFLQTPFSGRVTAPAAVSLAQHTPAGKVSATVPRPIAWLITDDSD